MPGGGGGGGYSPIKVTGLLAIPFRGLNLWILVPLSSKNLK